MADKTCPICGASFAAPPTGRKTCSDECESELRSRSQKQRDPATRQWSDEQRQAQSERISESEAAQKAAQKGSRVAEETGAAKRANRKRWYVVTPDGEVLGPIHNLRDWCKINADRFTEQGGWQRAYDGLRQVHAWMRGKRDRKVTQWKGWTLERRARPTDESETRWSGN